MCGSRFRIGVWILAFFWAFISVSAGERSESQMRNAAISVIGSKITRTESKSNLKLLKSLPTLKIYGYDNGGFAIVPTDDRFLEVIGYSTAQFTDSMPCGFKWWLESVDMVMQNTDSNVEPQFKSRNISKAGKSKVSPLISSRWGQTKPYNNKCTATAEGKTLTFVTGCVATAMAQIMNYYQYPTHGYGSYSYKINYSNWTEVTFSADFENTYYDWDGMLDDYSGSYSDRQAEAVATLMHDCAVAVNMKFNTLESTASSMLVPDAFKNYFGFPESSIYERENYSDEEWMDIIYKELENGRPIYYSARVASKKVGHAFLLHGYDTDGRVFVNWGWNGSYDGYYDIDMLKPNSSYYSSEQKIVVARPDKAAPTKTNYELSIKVSSGGYVKYAGLSLTNRSNSFVVRRGDDAELRLIPVSGYVLKSILVNGIDVTSQVSSNKYTIKNIYKDTKVEVTYEKKSTTYTLTITSGSGGKVVYDGYSISNTSRSFSVAEGSDATFTITPNSGYILSSVKVNNSDVTSQVSSGKYTIKNINKDTKVEVTYEKQPATYTLTISSGSGGKVVYEGYSISNTSRSFSVAEGSDATLTITPNNGYRLSSVKVNNSDVTSQVSSNKYTIKNINKDTKVEVAYEKMPTTYTLTITSGSGGKVVYEGYSITNASRSFSVTECSDATLTITPNNGFRLSSVKVNNSDVTSLVSSNKYTIKNITRNTDAAITFEVIPTEPVEKDDYNYIVLELTSGSKVIYQFAEKPKIAFENNKVIITTSRTKTAYKADDIGKVYLVIERTTGLSDKWISHGMLSVRNDIAFLQDLEPSEAVAIYDINGRLLKKMIVQPDGTLTIILTEIPKGVSIIKTKHQSFKFMRK